MQKISKSRPRESGAVLCLEAILLLWISFPMLLSVNANIILAKEKSFCVLLHGGLVQQLNAVQESRNIKRLRYKAHTYPWRTARGWRCFIAIAVRLTAAVMHRR